VDLRGHDPRHALSATEALAHLLRSLGVVDERLPGEPAERAALYRSLLHDRRCVIVLDNAPAVEDVLPLVPGTGPALLLVTSRHSGAALGSRHAVHPIALDALDQASSLALLTRVLGADLVARQSGPSARLVRLCGGMPLALRIAAARLVGKPDRAVGELAAELAGTDGLDTLAVEGDSRTVRAVLASAYRPLDPAAGMMFRRLGLSPGSTVSAALGAALCGVPIEQGRRAAERLASAHLVSANGPDRFRFHDLTRGFARQVARTDDAATLAETVDRLIDWYLVVAAGANHAIDADRDLVTPTLRHPPPELPFSADRHTALAFLSTERDNLLPVVRYAVEHGRPAAAWQLTYLLTGFYDATGHWHERVELCRQGAAAATALGDPLAQAEMLRALGVAYFMVRRMEDALAANAAALRVAEASGDLNGEGHIHNNMANAYVELRRFDEAITAHRMAVDRSAAAGNRLGHALAQRNLGYTYVRMGRAEDSLAPLTAALAAFRDLGNDRLAAATLDTLGEAHLELGQHHLALVHLDEAVSVSRDIGDRWMESESLLDAGVVRLGLGDSTAALADFEQALTISREVGDRHGEASALRRIGRVHLGTGDLDAARADLRSAVAVRAEAPDDYQEAHLYRDLAEVEERSGWPELSAAHRARAITLYRQANAMAEADALATAARR
jgi:tetratricopeptide (TPR) repeat protein